MSNHPHRTKALLPVLLLMLGAVAGCPRQSTPEQKEEPAAQSTLVTKIYNGLDEALSQLCGPPKVGH